MRSQAQRAGSYRDGGVRTMAALRLSVPVAGERSKVTCEPRAPPTKRLERVERPSPVPRAPIDRYLAFLTSKPALVKAASLKTNSA